MSRYRAISESSPVDGTAFVLDTEDWCSVAEFCAGSGEENSHAAAEFARALNQPFERILADWEEAVAEVRSSGGRRLALGGKLR